MANSNRCTTCQGKRGKQVPGNCTECSGGTHQAMVTLCPTCTKGRCEVCKTPLTRTCGTPTPTNSIEFGAGPTGFGGC